MTGMARSCVGKLCLALVVCAGLVLPGSAQTPAVEELFRRGKTLYITKKYHEAALAFYELAKKNPTQAVYHAYLGNSLFKSGSIEEAREALSVAIGLDPAEPKYLSNLGGLYATEKDWATAVELFRRAYAMKPEDGTLKKNFDSAEMMLNVERMAEELLTQRGDFWDVQGFMHGRNYTEKTEVAFRLALEKFPALVEVGINLLREAVAQQPDFVVMSHILANTLYAAIVSGNLDENDAQARFQEVRSVMRAAIKHDTKITGIEPGACRVGEGSGKLHMVAVATSPRAELDRLAASAKELGMNLVVLGMGNKWEGLGSKITWLYDYLKGLGCEDYLLFLDAYDVLLTKHADELLPRFREADVPLLFGAEKNCAPDDGLRFVYPSPSPSQPFHYLNSGTYLGKVKDVAEMLREIRADIEAHHQSAGASCHRLDDQRWFTRYFLRHMGDGKIELDVHAKVFHTLHDVEPHELTVTSDGNLWSNITKSFPCAVHGNGNGIDTFHDVSRRLVARGWPNGSSAETSTSTMPGALNLH